MPTSPPPLSSSSEQLAFFTEHLPDTYYPGNADGGDSDERPQLSPHRTVLHPFVSRSPLSRPPSHQHHPSDLSNASYSTQYPFDPLSLPSLHQQPHSLHTALPPNWPDVDSSSVDWGQDPFTTPGAETDYPALDPFLSLIAENDWSSPSGYTGFTDPPQVHNISPSGQGASNPTIAQTLRQPGTSPGAIAPATIYQYQIQSSPAGHSFSLDDNPQTSAPRPEMPTVTRHQAASRDGHRGSVKRQRTLNEASVRGHASLAGISQLRSEVISESDSDIFGDHPEKGPGDGDANDESGDAIDLTEANDVPEALVKPEIDNRIKIGGFQCAICMDSVTGLTLTHCGHLFCAACLHQSLHVDSTKGKCPMCRSKIEMKDRSTWGPKAKGFWPLELKLMTSSRKGKRKADAFDE